MRQFGALLNQHYRTKRSVSDYAPLLHVTVNHLKALCRRVLSKTASAVIHERVVVEAQGLLSHSALGVAQVGYELGFEDASYLHMLLSQSTPAPRLKHSDSIDSSCKRLQMDCAGARGAQ